MSKAEEAFSRAAMCADQAQAAQDEERRTFFNRLWDSWLRVAHNYQIAESLAADAAPPRPAGMIMGGLEAAEAPRSDKPSTLETTVGAANVAALSDFNCKDHVGPM